MSSMTGRKSTGSRWGSSCTRGKAPSADILDYDLVYYDRDLSEERERSVTREARELVADLRLELDVKNQARVHLWPATATAIGVRPSDQQLEVWAPFGTDDLFNLVVRPNRVQITPAIYDAKVTRWVARWPSLVALTWEEGVGSSGLRRLDAAIR